MCVFMGIPVFLFGHVFLAVWRCECGIDKTFFFFSFQKYSYNLWNCMARAMFLLSYRVQKIACFCCMDRPVVLSPCCCVCCAHRGSLAAKMKQWGHNVCGGAATCTQCRFSAAVQSLSPRSGFQPNCKDFPRSCFDTILALLPVNTKKKKIQFHVLYVC